MQSTSYKGRAPGSRAGARLFISERLYVTIGMDS